MAFLAPFLSLIPTAALATAGGVIAAGVPVASAAASVGTSIAGAVQSAKKPPQPPDLAKRQSLLAQRLASGRTSRGETGLSAGGKGIGDLSAAPIGKRTLLGG